jgi:tetratricopeptide (TPR) repeat protein
MSITSVQRTLAEAIEHHRGGRLPQAEALYRQILKQQPDHPDALHLLGVVALQAGNPTAALELIQRAVRAGESAAALNNLGEAFRHLRRFDEAIASYRKSLELEPRQVDANANMSLALEQLGRHEEAAQALERAAEIQPNRIDLHGAAGSKWAMAGNPYRAAAAFRRVIALDARIAAAHSGLATALAHTGAIDEALAASKRALELAPNDASAHGSHAVVLDRAGRLEESVAAFERAAKRQPSFPDYYGHRATVLERLERFDQALDVYRQGCRACPNDARLFSNLSSLLRRRRLFGESVEAAETAVRLAPAYSDAHGNLALSRLAVGDYVGGFQEYEWRWRCDSFTTAQRDFNRPMWDGSDPSGRTILVHTEQGHGDAIQFMRYVPMLAARGATVMVECHHSLRKLAARVQGVSRVISSGTALPEFDLHAPLLSLPRAFNTTLDAVPRDVPYLSPEPERVEAWKRKLDTNKFKVGLIWAGNAKPDPKRTIPGALLQPLVGVANVQFYSLQKRDATTFSAAPQELNLIDLDPDLTDFHETAASMWNLDLIITLDSAPAHLAGALGRSTWTLLPYAPDWRWLLERDDSPWYPTMRLFRQSRDDDWTEVIERVRNELTKLAQ